MASVGPYDEKRGAKPTKPNGSIAGDKKSKVDYTSDGVTDHDVLNLPGSDWQLLGVLTGRYSLVRLSEHWINDTHKQQLQQLYACSEYTNLAALSSMKCISAASRPRYAHHLQRATVEF